MSTSDVAPSALVGALLAEEECVSRRCRPALHADKQGGASTCFLAGDVVDLAPRRRRDDVLRGGRQSMSSAAADATATWQRTRGQRRGRSGGAREADAQRRADAAVSNDAHLVDKGGRKKASSQSSTGRDELEKESVASFLAGDGAGEK